MMKLESKSVYGPVWSRRFGWDLGVNLLPVNRKLCTFDCVYCQYGFTPALSNQTDGFPQAAQIIKEWEQRLAYAAALRISIYHTTVSGNGEPTMHPQFGKIIPDLVGWRDENAPQIKLAILSNGYRLHDPAIREAMHYFDEPIIKLDSAIPGKFQEINRPLGPFSMTQFLEDLKHCPRLILQTMFIKGWNDRQEDLQAWRRALSEIRPLAVQIYTVTRDTALPNLHPLAERDLFQIAEETAKLVGVPVHAFV